MSLRLLFVAHTLPLPDQPLSNVGGMQRVSVETLDALRRHPRVELSTLLLRSSSRWTGIRTVPFLAGLLSAIPRMVRQEGIEAVLFSSMVTAAVSVPLRARLRSAGVRLGAIPLGLDVTLPNPVYQRFVPRVFDALDVAFPISRATAQEGIDRGLRPERLRVVPCGADLTRFPLVHDRAAARAGLLRALADAGEAPLPKGALLVCGVGRHQERKGFHWFVDQVMPRLPGDVVFLLGGAGPMTPTIREAVQRHGLEHRVRLLGRIPEETLVALYRGADLFVMPNVPVPGDMEGFGVVMLEAGLSGLPTIAADLEGIRDVVEPGENGELLPSGDAAAFADAILRFRDEPDRLRAASHRARAYVEERFSWDRIVDRFVSAFEELPTPSGRQNGGRL